MEIMRVQQAVLKREVDMPTYNRVYKEHLDAIHALEARLRELQGGVGAAGGGP